MRTVFLDTETTGLRPPQDRIVEIAIADETGEVLLNELVNPGRPIGFATTIHGITDAMVARAPPIDLLAPQIARIVEGAHVVIYNAQYDTRFFPDRLRSAAHVSCAMLRFARIYGASRNLGPRAPWQKLTVAADYVGHTWDGAAHRALADVHATRAVWDWMDALEGEAGARRASPDNQSPDGGEAVSPGPTVGRKYGRQKMRVDGPRTSPAANPGMGAR